MPVRRKRRPARPLTRYVLPLVCTLCLLIVICCRRPSSRTEFLSLSSTRSLSHASILRILSSPLASRIIVSEPSKVIFCPTPKAANTNWKYLLRKWANVPDYTDLHASHNPFHSSFRYLCDYSATEALHLLTSPQYFRFLFVRDPYVRLLSAYMDKFRNTNPEYLRSEYRLFLAQLYSWRVARSIDIFKEPRPSFTMFVDEIAKHKPSEMNAHWMPQSVFCGIGLIPYDFIGRMEHLQRDVKHVFDRLNKSQEHFPSGVELGFPPSGASTHLAEEMYTEDLKYKVRLIYQNDFHLLGYN